jgi:hypothetical protein
MTMRAPISIAACLLTLVAACGGTTTVTFSETVEDDGQAEIEVEGLVIEVEPPILYRSTLTMTGGETERTSTIAGKSYGLRDGTFFIGDAIYGPADQGDRVDVSEDGVFVNGERRGDAP